MKLPISWLNDYMKLNVSKKEYADALTMSGSKVETIECPGDEIDKVVVGKILKIEKHPDADKLVVCQTDVGTEVLQIVTAAPNVSEGILLPVALHGAKLAKGVTIKRGKLRGVESNGMFCSTDELGITEDRATGIMILQGDIPLGSDIKKVLGLDEMIVDFDITSNRSDCFSVIGLARETAATFDLDFAVPELTVKECADDSIQNYISVEVKNSKLCPRYTARAVKDIKIGPSPAWMQHRLNACGVRSINNIVDITNYVMLEYGQPMHAFDIDFLKDGKIIVRNAEPGEKITTLDETERELNENMLVISDAERAVALAGVMGGANSEINENTKTIIFESANFLGSSVRTTAKAVGLRTESSSRYEKEIDPALTMAAIERACSLICELNAGTVVSGVIDIYPEPEKPVQLPLRPDYINRFLGTNIPLPDMIKILEKLEFTVSDDLTVTVPSFRRDIESVADVAEEIARFYGYEKIESTLMGGQTVIGEKTPEQKYEDRLKNTLVSQGLYEIMTYAFTDPKHFDRLLLPENSPLRKTVTITNPLGAETSVMRTTMLSEMMTCLARNFNQRNEEARLFELASIYLPKEDANVLPVEKTTLCIGMYGNLDFYDIKGAVEEILESSGIKKAKFVPCEDNPSYHPYRTAKLILGNQEAGILGQIHPKAAENYGIDVPVYTAELDFALLLRFAKFNKSYKHLPKFPAVSRDLALLADEAVCVGDIEEVIKRCSKNHLENIKLFDVYSGKQIPSGKKSIAYSLIFRDENKTLNDSEISEIMNKIMTELKDKLKVELRQ